MEDKIEVGEYVRVNNDNRNCIGIGKAIRLVNESVYVNMNNKYNLSVCFQINNIVKHSKIISEVVKAGDYVNGKLIHKIDKGPNYCYLYYGKGKTFVDYQIKTILTKEQYMANCYKVGGEDE